MTTRRIDLSNEMFQPVTLAEVLAITQRSQRTINRWIQTGRLTAYEEANRRQIIFNEDEVVELEHEKTVAKRQGRPRPKKHETAHATEGIDAGG